HRDGFRDRLATEASFLGSLRFRLTAWFTLMLIVILVTFGIILRTVLLQSLENDVNQRLLNSALQIENQTEVYLTADPNNPYTIVPPSFSNLVLSGTWAAMIQVTPTNEGYSIGYLKNPEPTIPDPDTSLANIDYTNILTSGKPEVQKLSVNGKPARVLIAPFDPIQSGHVSAIVVVGQSDESLHKTIDLLTQVLLLAGGIGMVASALIGWLVAGQALAPIGRIIRTADQIALNQNDVSLSKRLPVPASSDELALLALTFNNMLERLEAAFAAQQRFVADASHELRTPLTAMRGNVDVLLRQLRSGRAIPPEVLEESLDDVHREGDRMGRLITDLLTLARTDASGLGARTAMVPVQLEVVAQEAFRTGQALARGQDLVLDIRKPVVVIGEADKLTQVAIILLENAIRHTPEGGTITLTLDEAPASGDDPAAATISVEDSGEGITAEHLPHLFERFYRVEGARSRASGGTGLGLSIALSIVREHEGWIDVESGPGLGTVFTISIPLPPAMPPQEGNGSTNRSRIPRLGRGRSDGFSAIAAGRSDGKDKPDTT
ncbi:MAG TPA: ATP-binding protein, partial [Thermomicrobiales bacterium]|nr:ATP-binding protein [Thermomicrobiales bacterium]